MIWLFFVSFLSASEVSLEVGSVTSTFNYFQIPNKNSNRVSLADISKTSLRFNGRIDVGDKYQVSFLYAPLEVDYSFDDKRAFDFDGNNFQANTATDVKYKFNSYRLGFLRIHRSQQLNLWWGATAKIRDALIRVTQGSESKEFSNVGFVPLLSFGASLRFSQFELFTHWDGLGSSQGSAYDGSIELRYVLSTFSLGIGRRILGGGADNDQLKNFAQFDSSFANLNVRF